MGVSQLINHRTFKTNGYMRYSDKLRTLNLIYHNPYCRQTCQGGDLLQEPPFIKLA